MLVGAGLIGAWDAACLRVAIPEPLSARVRLNGAAVTRSLAPPSDGPSIAYASSQGHRQVVAGAGRLRFGEARRRLVTVEGAPGLQSRSAFPRACESHGGPLTVA